MMILILKHPSFLHILLPKKSKKKKNFSCFDFLLNQGEAGQKISEK